MFEHSERTKYKPKLSGRTSNRTKVFTPKNRKIFARNISTSNAYLDLVKCPDHCEFVLDSRWNGPVNLVTFPFFFSFSLARIIQYLVYFAIFFSFLLFNFFKFVPMVLVAVAVAVPATTSMSAFHLAKMIYDYLRNGITSTCAKFAALNTLTRWDSMRKHI